MAAPKLVPPVATTLTVDKLSREEVEEMLAAEQRAATRRALQEKFGDRNLNLSLERLDYLRRRALDEESAANPRPRRAPPRLPPMRKPPSSKTCAATTASTRARPSRAWSASRAPASRSANRSSPSKPRSA
jgi:hypothetical protein